MRCPRCKKNIFWVASGTGNTLLRSLYRAARSTGMSLLLDQELLKNGWRVSTKTGKTLSWLLVKLGENPKHWMTRIRTCPQCKFYMLPGGWRDLVMQDVALALKQLEKSIVNEMAKKPNDKAV